MDTRSDQNKTKPCDAHSTVALTSRRAGKLQNASYKAKIEKWESDSESDEGSADEADLAV